MPDGPVPSDTLAQLESRSIYILREAFHHFDKIAMLWSVGKDSNVILWLVRKAFFGHVPFPLVHLDTSYEIPELIAFRDRLVAALNAALDDATVRSRYVELGSTAPMAADRGPAGLQKLVESEIARITPVLKAAGIAAN